VNKNNSKPLTYFFSRIAPTVSLSNFIFVGRTVGGDIFLSRMFVSSVLIIGRSLDVELLGEQSPGETISVSDDAALDTSSSPEPFAVPEYK
jgi:hypothetical protein